MVPVAYRVLCRLRNQRLSVMQYQLLKLAAQVEFLLQYIRLYPITLTCALHDDASCCAATAQEMGNSSKTFISYDCEPYRRAIFYSIYRRNDTGDREIYMGNRRTGFIKHMPQRH